MNGQNHQPQTRVMREIPKEWDKIISLAEQIPNGGILVKIYNKQIVLERFYVDSKPDDPLKIIPLGGDY